MSSLPSRDTIKHELCSAQDRGAGKFDVWKKIATNWKKIAMKAKRIVLLLLAVCTAAGLLAGCKNNQQAVDWDNYTETTSTLTLYDYGLTDEDIAPIQNLTGLTKLTLTSNQISDLTPLANLTKLTELSLSNNQIKDLSPLANLTNLTELYLVGNQISDLSPLANLTNLARLFLDDNQVSDLTPLANLANLTVLTVRNNRIADWSHVAFIPNVEGNPVNAVFLTDTTTRLETGVLFSLSLDETQSIPSRWTPVFSDATVARLICTEVDSSGVHSGTPPGSGGEERIFYFEALAPGECTIDMYLLPINSDYDIDLLSPSYSYTVMIED